MSKRRAPWWLPAVAGALFILAGAWWVSRSLGRPPTPPDTALDAGS